MKTARINPAKTMGSLLWGVVFTVAGLIAATATATITATTAHAQQPNGYDRNAELITGVAIGLVAGYVLMEAQDRYVTHDEFSHHSYPRQCCRNYRGDRHYSYHRYDHHHGHYRNKRHSSHRVYRVHEGSREGHRRHGSGYDKRVTVTHF